MKYMALSGVHFRFIVVALVAFSFVRIPAFAAGEDDTTPPPPSPTATCPKGQINNPKTGKCKPAKSNSLSDLDRYQAVRDLG